MLENISWSTYWVWVTVIIIIYYSITVFLFYRLEISQAILKSSRPQDPELQNDADHFAVVHVLMADIENSCRSLNRQTPKQECLEILKKHISRYPQLKHTAFQNAVNNRVSELLHNTCSIPISEKELAVIWKDDD